MEITDRMIKEAVRYLGYGREIPDEQILVTIRDLFLEIAEKTSPKHIAKRLDISVFDDEIVFGNVHTTSVSLRRNLGDCKELVLLGATLGPAADLLMKRYSVTNMAQAVILQACEAAYLEEYIDQVQDEMEEELREEGAHFRPRFSPGYGDFSITNQEKILTILDSAKKIGLTMTDSCMLTPTKSVTAVMGISTCDEVCHKAGCESCMKTDCKYRRNGDT